MRRRGKEVSPATTHKSVDGTMHITRTHLVFEYNFLARIGRSQKRSEIPLAKIETIEVIYGRIDYLTVTVNGWSKTPDPSKSATAFALHPRKSHAEFLDTLMRSTSAQAVVERSRAPVALQQQPPRKSHTPVVRVLYRDLDKNSPLPDPADMNAGYAFRWSHPHPLDIGDRVFVQNDAGDESAAIVVGFGTKYRGQLLSVSRIATPQEMQDAATKERAGQEAWLNMARRAAGLPTPGRARKNPPEGFPELTPTDGAATRQEASTYARPWWRAYKLAQEMHRPDEEIKAYAAIAHRWYAVRDKGGNAG